MTMNHLLRNHPLFKSPIYIFISEARNHHFFKHIKLIIFNHIKILHGITSPFDLRTHPHPTKVQTDSHVSNHLTQIEIYMIDLGMLSTQSTDLKSLHMICPKNLSTHLSSKANTKLFHPNHHQDPYSPYETHSYIS